ncbi:MAG: hypothetical protein U0894_03220 [Pirellulales bacterium]
MPSGSHRRSTRKDANHIDHINTRYGSSDVILNQRLYRASPARHVLDLFWALVDGKPRESPGD